MIFALDPGHDREAKLSPRTPRLSVEHVLLQEAKEAFHGCIVASRPDSAHRPTEFVPLQCLLEFS